MFNYAEYQIDYLLRACGCSLLSGYGSGYPTYVWHESSYNLYLDCTLQGPGRECCCCNDQRF